jgi:hypothetical protein
MNSNDITVPKIQRALILKGGGALGAYQVARILSIDFSKDNRFVELIGTQMTS